MTYLKNPENGYTQSKQVNGVDICLTYRPTDLLVAQELRGATSKTAVDSLRDKYHKYLYFNLNISKNGKELLSAVPKDRNEFGAMVNELSFGMEQNVHLFTNKKDTIPMMDYIYPRMYGMGSSTSMLLVYPRNKELTNSEFFKISLKEIGLLTGEVNFKFNTTLVQEEPSLSKL
ncbi:hypothetical protein POV27_14265 [Aureisphaera galaxeae]|uniref:hypothetical protein n=1 Tax=Aureisphaera galaxeae TaxID=1538023 RepID=UPI00234FC844|nr:hypothetical protein [Aureisphaera galaxeae]MDC8005222.1 hypothetical protein [Aureisphaera galaxeae]